ncbi:hypothetical protein ABD91_00735 [Lysinibacillus sphaericus]|uniref:hypothetical protein n=1 Tax=Lysinibacillus sphaericus TaxID=1421 RepID=UPI0018CDFD71|nr:hypothetical protein [Lysinibacillus sphaericus]MBG9689453.1 hypothetical protein [Lysinibacillus sphaericus]
MFKCQENLNKLTQTADLLGWKIIILSSNEGVIIIFEDGSEEYYTLDELEKVYLKAVKVFKESLN